MAPPNSAPKLLLLACGKLGTALAGRMTQAGWAVTGLRRHPPAQTSPEGMHWLAADLVADDWLSALDQFEYVVYTPSPAGRALSAYELLYDRVIARILQYVKSAPSLKLWLQVSSTSVYGQAEGEWVDESSPAQPTRASARLIRQAEDRLQQRFEGRACALRFSGIYGGDRQFLLRNVVQGKALRAQHFTNRIHQEDCVGIMAAIVQAHAAGRAVAPIYVGTDKTPVSEWHIGAWLANRLGVRPPERVESGLSGKRCVSTHIDDLPYRFKYPTYESGYGAQIDALRVRSPDWLAQLR